MAHLQVNSFPRIALYCWLTKENTPTSPTVRTHCTEPHPYTFDLFSWRNVVDRFSVYISAKYNICYSNKVQRWIIKCAVDKPKESRSVSNCSSCSCLNLNPALSGGTEAVDACFYESQHTVFFSPGPIYIQIWLKICLYFFSLDDIFTLCIPLCI